MFCAEAGISRKTFYALRARGAAEGPAAVLEPKSRRPRTSPSRVSEDLKDQAVAVREALERSGLDHGPISVFERMRKMGIIPPSEASLARIFRERGVARLEPKKKPRSAYRRFVYPAPNACWQLDAAEYVLTGGRTPVIFQLQDDHSRLAVASHVATGETSEGAMAVMRKGIAACGVPQRLLTDNGAALNPHRRNAVSQLVEYARSLGIETITGKPGKPTTQGKNERFHQTLFRWLNAQPMAATIQDLQDQVDQFDLIYNTDRPHQGLPGRITPRESWDATPVAEPPRPEPDTQVPALPAQVLLPGEDVPADDDSLAINRNGTVMLRGVTYYVTSSRAGEWVNLDWDDTTIRFVDDYGEVLAEHHWPTHGTRYVGKNSRPSPMS